MIAIAECFCWRLSQSQSCCSKPLLARNQTAPLTRLHPTLGLAALMLAPDGDTAQLRHHAGGSVGGLAVAGRRAYGITAAGGLRDPARACPVGTPVVGFIEAIGVNMCS